MSYEDFWWETHYELQELKLQNEFNAQLEKMKHQDKHKYKSTRDKWEYAHNKVKKQYNKK